MSDQTTAPTVTTTRRDVWLEINSMIVERSLPVPRNVGLIDQAHHRIVSLYFDENGEADRWGASLDLGEVEFDDQGDHLYYGHRAGWSWNIRCIPVQLS